MWTVECRTCNGVMRQDARGIWAGIDRDDLIRLVVGMQWHMAMLCHHDYGCGVLRIAWTFAERTDLRPAVDIVDEWLGVR